MSEPSRKVKVPKTVWMLIAFIPWILYWSLSGAGLHIYAITAGLVSSVLLNAYRACVKRPMIMDAVTLCFFAVNSVSTLVLNSSLFLAHGSLIVYLTLSAMALGSIVARNPFTYQYAKYDWPREYWKEPLFVKTNNMLTAVWGVVLLTDAGISLLATGLPRLVIPNILLVAVIVFSMMFPRWYTKRVLAGRYLKVKWGGDWRSPAVEKGRALGENEHDVIVVGAGIGGLTCGALLAKRGLKVLVAEQHALVGGYCTSFSRGGFVFDGGVESISWLEEHGVTRNVLRELELEDKIEFIRVDSEYILPDFRIKIPRGVREFEASLCQLFQEEADNIHSFFREMLNLYNDLYRDLDKTGGVPSLPKHAEQVLKFPLTHPYQYRWMNKTFDGMLKAYFKTERIRAVLSVLTSYLGVPSEKLQATSMAPIFGYYIDGGYYPRGGSQSLANALAKAITDNGGTILKKSLVERILVQNGEARGVRLSNGQEFKAGVIVSNADGKKTFLDLVGREHLSREFVEYIEGLRMSTSAFMVYLGLDFKPDLEPHTFHVPRYGLAKNPFEDPNIGIIVNSLLDPSLAPPGQHSMTITTLVPYTFTDGWGQRTSEEYKRRKREVAAHLIKQAEKVVPDLSKHIVFQDAATPVTFERYTLNTGGALYSFEQTPDQMDRNRPHFKTPIKGLYLAGASTFPGGGIEAVMISGTTVANDITSGARRN